jgi:hypothetical protein
VQQVLADPGALNGDQADLLIGLACPAVVKVALDAILVPVRLVMSLMR